MREAPARRAREAQQRQQRERGQRDQRLEQLDVERHADQCSAGVDPDGPVSTARVHEQRERADQQHHHHAVHRVAARRQYRDRQDRECSRGGQRGGRAEHAPQRDEQQRHGGCAGERLRQLQRRRVEAEQLHARDLQPQVERRFVDRDAAPGLVCPEEEVVPRQRHAAHRRVVERVAGDLRDGVEPQHRGERDHSADGEPPHKLLVPARSGRAGSWRLGTHRHPDDFATRLGAVRSTAR